MLIQLKVYRYQPETSDKPYFDTFQIKAEPTDRVLD
ncbi:MAG: succinate dehydrogenase iron-sulfur subunit, partial [Anaerolineaceae bacterium]|nr:succinate dehydrogenase iron-sulfur subunit [Anaerolineaceae bacterium]